MFASAAILLLFGMGFVFVFLLIQVWITAYFAKLAAKYAYLLPEPTKPVKKKPAAQKADDTEAVAVIAAALRQNGRL